MTRRVLLGLALAVFGPAFLVPAALAGDQLPDLPGMGPAQSVVASPPNAGGSTTSGGTATSGAAATPKPSAAPSPTPAPEKVSTSDAQAPTATDLAKTEADLSKQAKPILSLPGAGALPVIGGVEVGVGSASGHRSAGSRTLVVLAGLGSVAAVAGLFGLRRAGIL